MPSLTFTITGAEPILFAAAPTLGFQLLIKNADLAQQIQSVALRAQIMIEATSRPYAPEEKDELRDLFGEPDRWSQTLRPLLWTHAATTIQAFTAETVNQLAVPCTFDFNVGAAKYFHAVKQGDVPLTFQWSGTIFYAAPDSHLQIDQIGWDKESRFRLPAQVWRDMMDHYYPDSAWLRLRRDTFERVYEYKRRHSIATWDEALETLLALEKETVA